MLEIINKIVAFGKTGEVSAVVVFLGMCVEFWLGRTEMVKAGSTIELVLNGIKKAVDLVRKLIGV